MSRLQRDYNQTSNSSITDDECYLIYKSEYNLKDSKIVLADLGQLDVTKYYLVKDDLVLSSVNECTTTLDTIDVYRCRKCYRTFTSTIALLRHNNSHRRKVISAKHNNKVVKMNLLRKYNARKYNTKLYLNNIRECIKKKLICSKSESVLSESIRPQSSQQLETQSQTAGDHRDTSLSDNTLNTFQKNAKAQAITNIITSEQGNVKHLKYKCFSCERRFEDCYQLFRHNVQVHHTRPVKKVKVPKTDEKSKESVIKKGVQIVDLSICDKNETTTSQASDIIENIDKVIDEIVSTFDEDETVSEPRVVKEDVTVPNHKPNERKLSLVLADKNILFNKFREKFKQRNRKATSAPQVTATPENIDSRDGEVASSASGDKVIGATTLTCDEKTMSDNVVNVNRSLVTEVQKHDDVEKFSVVVGNDVDEPQAIMKIRDEQERCKPILPKSVNEKFLTGDKIDVNHFLINNENNLTAHTDKMFNEFREKYKKRNLKTAPAVQLGTKSDGIDQGCVQSDKARDEIILCDDSNESSEIYNLDGVDIICNDIDFENHNEDERDNEKLVDDLGDAMKNSSCADNVFFDEQKPDIDSISDVCNQDNGVTAKGGVHKQRDLVLRQAPGMLQIQPTNSAQSTTNFIYIITNTTNNTCSNQIESNLSSLIVKNARSTEVTIENSNTINVQSSPILPMLSKLTNNPKCALKILTNSPTMQSKGIVVQEPSPKKSKIIELRNVAKTKPQTVNVTTMLSRMPPLKRIELKQLPPPLRKIPRILRPNVQPEPHDDDVIEIGDSSNDEADDETTQTNNSNEIADVVDRSKNLFECKICKVVKISYENDQKSFICQSCKVKENADNENSKILLPDSKNVHSPPNYPNESNADNTSDDEGSRLVIDFDAPGTSEIPNPEKSSNIAREVSHPSKNSSKVLESPAIDVIEINDEQDDGEKGGPSRFLIAVVCANCKKETSYADISVRNGKVICKECDELKTIFDCTKPTLKCFYCSEEFDDSTSVIKHKNEVHFCSICGKYRKNVAKHHESIRNCKLCPTIFCKKITLNEHYRYHHFKRWCHMCDVVLNDDYEGLIHNTNFHKNIS